mmetsp:Transcript_2152/g.4990  ORF Transcript_2152/g.4990 Transcript_2152/m.4990 type:complete len:250 (+) Transcript_2152:328-1077(+)
MNDLAVQISHQPVHVPARRVDVHGVIDRVVHPAQVLIRGHDREVRVARGEVREEVHVRDPVAEGEPPVRDGPRVPRREFNHRGPDDVRDEHPRRLLVVLLSQHLPRVQDVDPERLDEQPGGHRDERPRLKPSPRAGEPPRPVVLHGGVKKRHRGGRVQVHVVPHFLRRRVVLIVHLVPHLPARGQPEPARHRLEALVDVDGPRERVVPALVLDPTAPRAEERAVHDGRDDRVPGVHEGGAEGEGREELE